MIKGFKVRINPTEEQKVKLIQFCGANRFIYNWVIKLQDNNYKSGNKFIDKYSLDSMLTQLKKKNEFLWLNDISSTTLKKSVSDCCDSYIKFFKGLSNYPKFKSKKKNKLSFFVRTDRMNQDSTSINIEKIGRIKIKKYSIPVDKKLYNTRCSFDGKYWILSYGIEVNENQVNLNKDLSIGVDLGIKELAILSNGNVYKNINKSEEMMRLYKKLKRVQRKVSNKYEMNKVGNKFIKTNNIIKLEKQIKLIHRKISNIRETYNHKLTSNIIKLKPYRVVIEDLNIKGMMKNRHLSKAISRQGFYEIRRQLSYKCLFNGIELVIADRFYPSSKTCSHCGNIKKDLKLSDRIYKCEHCNFEIDRDLNASINLSKYSK